MATRPQVEARSLSDINYLAANPPQYPHHPEVRESLTLYISRVPGTQDVILSTLKPQRKNVTGEDVANSLYYVHLDLPSDGLLAARPRRPEGAASPRSSSESARSAIPRKPLPASTRVLMAENTPDPSARQLPLAKTVELTRQAANPLPLEATAAAYPPNPALQDKKPGPPLGVLDGDQRPELPPRPPAKHIVPVTRKPLGPRPLGAPGTEVSMPTSSTARERPITPTQHGPLSSETTNVASPSYAAGSRRLLSPGKAGRRPSVLPFSLTLIRRDPTTGGQWNVGRISSFQTNIPTPETADPSLNPNDMGAISRAQKIDIRLESSGYAKYRGMPSIASVESYRPGSGHSFAQAMKGLASGLGATGAAPIPRAAVAGSQADTEEGFVRQVVMAYSKTWTSNIKNPFHRRDRAGSSVEETSREFSPEDLEPPRKPFHNRANSSSSIASFDSASWLEGRDRQPKGSDDSGQGLRQKGQESPPSLTTQPGPGMKPKGYIFVSPWDGRCEFKTSTSGRSLKCRHILDPKSPKFNPVAVAQNIRDAQAMGRSRGDELTSALAGAKPVSELRFNLPSGDVFSSSRGGRHSETGKGKWDHHSLQSHFSKLLHPRSSDDDEAEEEDGPMDLSIGREDAGGGSRGKRAKLGKLIIHDEGLKMLDLVVAANIGVWWTTWGERSF